MPIQFTCPHCGAQSNVADQYAGQTGPCARCGQIITVPPLSGFSGGAAPAAKGGGGSPVAIVLTVLAVVGICVLGCAGIGIFGIGRLSVPGISAARQAAQRSQSQNNLKQIGLALHNYYDAFKSLPPAYIADENGRPMHSWRVLILPFLEEQNLYQQYRFDEPWDGPNNSLLASRIPMVYQPVNDPAAVPGTTHYLAIVGPRTVFPGATPTQFQNITDGLSNTIAIAEATKAVNWMEPTDLDYALMTFRVNDPGGNDIGSTSPGGANVMMMDGAVRFLPETIDPVTIQHLLEKDDGSVVPSF
jgi:hypothetical protein